MKQFPTKAYRVKFPSGDGVTQLTGIIDHPVFESAGVQPRVAVFSHCFTCNKDLKATVRISRALAKSGVAVLRFDMTGLGGSQGDFSKTNFTTNLADLRAAITFADQELGPVGALIGHSFGGVASLVTASQATNADSQIPLENLGFVATLAAPSDTQHLAVLLSRMSPEIDAVGQGTVTIGGIQWSIERQMLEDFRQHQVTDSLSEIRCPVLLMHSPVDETVGYDHAIRLMSLISTSPAGRPSPNTPVSLLPLPGADHLLIKNAADLSFVSGVLSAWCDRFA